MSRVGSPFRALWLAVFLFYLSFQLLVPVVPLYAVRLGASDVQLGLLTGLFAGTAMLLRPVVGQLTDSLGRRPLILLGSAIFAAAPLGYAAVGGLAALLALRVLHGSGMGFGQTAASVAAADLAPIARRGEALGVFGLASTFGIMLGPYAGIELYERFGSTTTFLVAASLAAGSVAVATTLPETRPPSAHAARPSGMLSAAALYPSALYLAFFFGYGGVVSFLPLFAEREQLGNPGLFYTLFALAGVAVRPGAGRLADRLGPPRRRPAGARVGGARARPPRRGAVTGLARRRRSTLRHRVRRRLARADGDDDRSRAARGARAGDGNVLHRARARDLRRRGPAGALR